MAKMKSLADLAKLVGKEAPKESVNTTTEDTVYSTAGNSCSTCGKPLKKCKCKSQNQNNTPTGDGIVRVGRTTKGKKGAGVTTITGLSVNDTELEKIAQELKKKCGCGGAVKNRIIEVQGNKRDQVKAELEKMGYKVKLTGG